MQAYNIKNARKKILVGDLVVYLILAVSLGVSIAYWYDLAGFRNSTAEKTTFWLILSYLVVAVGFTTEVVKKATISMFRNFHIWLFATLVSVLTIMGSYSILDQSKQNKLVKQSDGYQLALSQKKTALEAQAKYAYASGFNIADLEKQKRTAGKKARWGTFNRLKKDISAKRAYDSAVTVLGLSSQSLNVGGASTSTNPFLDSLAKPLGISGQLLKTIFFLLITLLLESAAFWIGGKVEELRNMLELTEAEILDLKLKSMYGVTMSELNAGLFANVLQAQIDQVEAEKQIEIIRKTSRKKLPVGEAITKIKQIQKQSHDTTDQAKQKNEALKKSEGKPEQPPRPSLDFAPTTAPTITAIFKPAPINIVPKQVQKKRPCFGFGFLPSGTRSTVPKQVQGTGESVPKQVHPENVPNRTTTGGGTGAKRKKETPDTGTLGANAHRYRAVIKSVKNGGTKPTHRGIKGFKYGGRGMGDDTARIYKKALERDGVI